MKKKDIQNLGDIKLLVDEFYGKVRKDDVIGVVFERHIQDRWPEHLEKMYAFWQTLLLEEKTYNGKPFPPHALLPISEVHFNRWLDLFQETTEKLFKGEKADEAVWRARKMAALFQHKLEYIRNNPDKPLLM